MNLKRPQYWNACAELVGKENISGGLADGPVSEYQFFNGAKAPTEKAIQAKLAELQADYDAKQYQRDRAVAYPSIQDQLDMQYHDAIDGTTTWKDAIAKVKADNPKP